MTIALPGESRLYSPVIIIGMHRSGTSVISSMLGKSGVFIGDDLGGGHFESNFFLRLNQKLLSLAHANWDCPMPVNWMFEDKEVFNTLCVDMRRELKSPAAAKYIGSGMPGVTTVSELADHRSAFSWGWKDPRNTFTLPLWLHLFPQAKIINVARNGVDVAHSLYTREARRKLQLNSIARSVRCQSLERCFDLWEEYLNQADNVIASLPPQQSLTVCYENFVTEPVNVLQKIMGFLEMPDSELPDVGEVFVSSNDSQVPAVVRLREQKQHSPLLLKHYRLSHRKESTSVA